MWAQSSTSYDDGFPIWSPQSSLFLSQNQNPSFNQTLEEAFSSLSVSASPFNHSRPDFNGYGPSDLNGASKISSFNGFEAVPFQSSNLGQMQASSYEGFLDSDPLMRQRRHFNNASLSVPPVQQKSPGGFLNDFQGEIHLWAKDQNGCRLLQELMEIATTKEFSCLFMELIEHVTELMVHPFGNYVVQKMVDICSEEQRTQIIFVVTKLPFELIRISLNPFGSRVVENLLQRVTTVEQRIRIVSALLPGAVTLAKDANGYRVFLFCLKHFTEEENQGLLNMVANNIDGIAIDKTGCRVLNQCVDRAHGQTKEQLILGIIDHAWFLANDSYGNYVVQHLLSLKIRAVTQEILRKLSGNFFNLACNKFGSNVVEKFFLYSEEQHSTRVILELLTGPNAAKLLVDPYGNYVIKSALLASKGAVHSALLKLIRDNSAMMRSNLYGNKLLAKFERGRIQSSTRTVTGFLH